MDHPMPLHVSRKPKIRRRDERRKDGGAGRSLSCAKRCSDGANSTRYADRTNCPGESLEMPRLRSTVLQLINWRMSRPDDQIATHQSIYRPPAGLSWRVIAVLVALTTLLVIVFAGQGYVALPGDRPLSELVYLLILQSLFWYLWIVLTPGVFAVATRLRLRSLGLVPRLACWAAMALLFVGLHTASFLACRLGVEHLWGGHVYPPDFSFGAAWWSYLNGSSRWTASILL